MRILAYPKRRLGPNKGLKGSLQQVSVIFSQHLQRLSQLRILPRSMGPLCKGPVILRLHNPQTESAISQLKAKVFNLVRNFTQCEGNGGQRRSRTPRGQLTLSSSELAMAKFGVIGVKNKRKFVHNFSSQRIFVGEETCEGQYIQPGSGLEK